MSVLAFDAPAPPLLTASSARALTSRLVGALVVTHDLLAAAYTGRAWEALGYPTWAAYCEHELVLERSLRLPRDQRRDVVGALADAGMPKRAIAASLGVADQTVRADLGAVRTPTPQLEQGVPKTSQAALLLAAAGEAGLTVHELCRKTSWHHGSASRVLHDLHRQHRAVRALVYRAGCGVYLHPSAA